MKLKITIEYAGETFSGWQFQPNQKTVQGELERALEIFLRSQAKKAGVEQPATPNILGSGRTDSGVHALGQVASFTWPEGFPFEKEKVLAGLNAITARELVVRELEEVPDSFDARLSPHIKCYTYRLLLRAEAGLKSYREGYFQNRAWCVEKSLDIAAMARAARLLEGQHDCASFRAKDCSAKTTVRTILKSEIARISDDEVLYLAYGKGFLKHMIRIVVGTLVEVGRGERSVESFKETLEACDRARAGQTAPPHGLTLQWVKYIEDDFWKVAQ